MIPPLGKKPSKQEIDQYSPFFPNLKKGEWKKTGESTIDYNCHAWGLCRTDWGWMQPFRETIRKFTIKDFDEFYAQHGFTIRGDSAPNCQPEYRKRKIALYCIDGEPKHSVKEIIDDSWWESKLGQGIRIIHRLEQLEGNSYGKICRCYSRDDENANLSLKGET